MTFSILGYLDNMYSEFYRTYYLFVKMKEENNKDSRYEDIFKKFQDRYDIDIYNYLEGLYVIIFCICEANYKGLKETRCMMHYNFIISSNQIQDPKTKNNVIKVIDSLCFNYSEAEKWAKETIDDIFNFDLFQKKPLYKLNDDCYLPITRKFLQDQIFYSFIYKIRALYGENSKTFFILLGEIFEDYLVYIFKQLVNNSKINYKLISEFEYGNKGKRKKSSDLIVCLMLVQFYGHILEINYN